MSLRGDAFLALWNDVDVARDAEYDCWHTFEHVPERVGIPGFIEGRRYVARERRDDRYFTLYDLAGLEVVQSDAYREVVEHPTEWSRSMRSSLLNFERHPCTIGVSLGSGLAGSIAACRFALGSVAQEWDAAAARALLEPFVGMDGITSIHLGPARRDVAFPLSNARSDVPASAGANHVLLIEGLERHALDRGTARVVAAVGQHVPVDCPLAWKSFDLAFRIDPSDLQYPTTARQPPRPDLMRRFNAHPG